MLHTTRNPIPIDIPKYTPDGRRNQWADISDPGSYEAKAILSELKAAKPLPRRLVVRVKSSAAAVFREVGRLKRVKGPISVGSVIEIFTTHSDKTQALYQEIDRFYRSQGIAEGDVRWFLVKEVMRILMSSVAARDYEISPLWLSRDEFERPRVMRLPVE